MPSLQTTQVHTGLSTHGRYKPIYFITKDKEILRSSIEIVNTLPDFLLHSGTRFIQTVELALAELRSVVSPKVILHDIEDRTSDFLSSSEKQLLDSYYFSVGIRSRKAVIYPQPKDGSFLYDLPNLKDFSTIDEAMLYIKDNYYLMHELYENNYSTFNIFKTASLLDKVYELNGKVFIVPYENYKKDKNLTYTYIQNLQLENGHNTYSKLKEV